MTDSGGNRGATELTLEHFKDLLAKIAKPGFMQKLLTLMPGMDDLRKTVQERDSSGELPRMIGAINAMTPAERRDPKVIDAARCHRIARGAGVPEATISGLLAQYQHLLPIMQIMTDSLSGNGPRLKMMQMLQDELKKKWKRRE